MEENKTGGISTFSHFTLLLISSQEVIKGLLIYCIWFVASISDSDTWQLSSHSSSAELLTMTVVSNVVLTPDLSEISIQDLSENKQRVLLDTRYQISQKMLLHK